MIPLDKASYPIDSCRTDKVLEYPACAPYPLKRMLNVLRAHRASIQVAHSRVDLRGMIILWQMAARASRSTCVVEPPRFKKS